MCVRAKQAWRSSQHERMPRVYMGMSESTIYNLRKTYLAMPKASNLAGALLGESTSLSLTSSSDPVSQLESPLLERLSKMSGAAEGPFIFDTKKLEGGGDCRALFACALSVAIGCFRVGLVCSVGKRRGSARAASIAGLTCGFDLRLRLESCGTEAETGMGRGMLCFNGLPVLGEASPSPCAGPRSIFQSMLGLSGEAGLRRPDSMLYMCSGPSGDSGGEEVGTECIDTERRAGKGRGPAGRGEPRPSAYLPGVAGQSLGLMRRPFGSALFSGLAKGALVSTLSTDRLVGVASTSSTSSGSDLTIESDARTSCDPAAAFHRCSTYFLCQNSFRSPAAGSNPAGFECSHTALALALPQSRAACTCSSVQSSRSTDLTFEICTPSERCTPEQPMQMKMQQGSLVSIQDAQRGSLSLQSAH